MLKSLWLYLASIALACSFLAPLAAADIRVDPTASGANSGTSWANARTDLTAALAAAASGDRVWVKAGTYRITGARTTSFTIKAGVAVYGGFAGTEAAITDRDWNAHPTILSGDINGDDPAYGAGFTFANMTDNAYHVVMGANGAQLDGFTVRGGNADYSATFTSNSLGGGIVTGTSAELNNIVQNNIWPSGSMTVANCIVENNSCDSPAGGILMLRASDILSGCVIRWNRAYADSTAADGGGVVAWGSQQVIDRCIFLGNSAILKPTNLSGQNFIGGALDTMFATRVTNSLFVGNQAKQGGAIFCSGSSDLAAPRSSPAIIGCTFFGNSAVNDGGSVQIGGRSDAAITNSLFSGSSAGRYGSEININAVGGQTPTLALTSSTIPGAGALHTDGVATVTQTNVATRAVAFANSASPFGADGIPLTTDDGFCLTNGSLEIDSGAVPTGANISHDILGFSRPIGAGYDRGAYEFNHAPTVSAIGNVATNQEVATAAIGISVNDLDGTANLAVTVASSNTTLIPNASLALTGSGTTWSLVATPATGQYGVSTITVTVSDGQLTASTTFTITVNAVNQPPVNIAIPGVVGANTLGMSLVATNGTWTDHETAPASLTFTYQWWRADNVVGTNATVIVGATGGFYTVQAADAGKAIRVVVSATDGGYGPAAAATVAANSPWIASGASAAQPAISSPITATGSVSAAFSYQITASNSPTSFNATGLPAGLSVDAATGLISGTPTTTGTSYVTLSATNASGSGSLSLAITILPASGGGSGSSSGGGGGGGGGCGLGGAAALLVSLFAILGFRRRR